jgi:CRISPR/Cas system-associated endonuclease Cas3-HD
MGKPDTPEASPTKSFSLEEKITKHPLIDKSSRILSKCILSLILMVSNYTKMGMNIAKSIKYLSCPILTLKKELQTVVDEIMSINRKLNDERERLLGREILLIEKEKQFNREKIESFRAMLDILNAMENEKTEGIDRIKGPTPAFSLGAIKRHITKVNQ